MISVQINWYSFFMSNHHCFSLYLDSFDWFKGSVDIWRNYLKIFFLFERIFQFFSRRVDQVFIHRPWFMAFKFVTNAEISPTVEKFDRNNVIIFLWALIKVSLFFWKLGLELFKVFMILIGLFLSEFDHWSCHIFLAFNMHVFQ